MTMGRAFTRACLGAAVLLWAGLVSAASWSVGSASGAAGDEVTIVVSFRSGGAAVGADLIVGIDQASLTMDEPAGELRNASREGRCGWNGANQLTALVFSGSTAPLPDEDLVVCEFKMRIRPTTPPGHTTLQAEQATCAAAAGNSVECETTSGAVRITEGPTPDVQLFSPGAVSLTMRLAKNGPSADDVVNASPERSPLEVFRQLRPTSIRYALSERGDKEFAKRLARNPDGAEAQGQRYVVADFASTEERDLAVRLLSDDAGVDEVSASSSIFPAADSSPLQAGATKAAMPQPHRQDLDFDGLWTRAGGWGLIGIVDTGTHPEHPDLRSFSGTDSIGGTWQVGGNYLPYFSYNHAQKGQPTNKLSELLPSTADSFDDPACGTVLHPTAVGHGTHVTGIVGANASDNAGVTGGCRNCGLAIRKNSVTTCKAGVRYLDTPTSASTDGIHGLIVAGAQVINMSMASDDTYCGRHADTTLMCNEFNLAQQRDVMLIAAAGNNRERVGFPATDARVTAVSGITGFDATGQPLFWDLMPNCPLFPAGTPPETDCGSNFRQSEPPVNEAHWNYIEFTARATSVQSTMFQGHTWNLYIRCGDSYDGVVDNYGPCTGTSQSAPQVAAIVGVLRSINPLIRVGTYWNTPSGIRGLMRSTGSVTVSGQVNDSKLGFGVPDGALAADRMLGRVGGERVPNRATPLFRLYSKNRDDYAAVATPHLAMALALAPTSAYRTTVGSDPFRPGVEVPGYSAFPDTAAGVPRALAMVLTTEYAPTGLPAPAPLYLMARHNPTGTQQDHLLVNADMVQLVSNAGYAYLGRQGFIYPWCSTTNCQPAGTQALHLKCKNASNATTRRCAVFLESERSLFEFDGFTVKFPNATRSELGWAYGIEDSDEDGLVDAVEYVIGTSVGHDDSDGDGDNDGVEYPLADLPVSDPCQGPGNHCPLTLNRIFKDSFE